MVFPMNKPLGGESMYHRKRRENESRYLVARKGDCILVPHQCEKIWFVNLCGCCPDSSCLEDSQTLEVIHRANLDIFWSCDTSTIHEMLGYEKELVIRAREADRSVPFPAITAWPMGDEVGMGVAIQI